MGWQRFAFCALLTVPAIGSGVTLPEFHLTHGVQALEGHSPGKLVKEGIPPVSGIISVTEVA
jgi:hypothetical protein